MKKIKYLMVLVALASVSLTSLSSCVVRAHTGVYVRGHYEDRPEGRVWVRAHYQ